MLRPFVLGLGFALVSLAASGCGSRAALLDETPTGAGGAGSTQSGQNGTTATGAGASMVTGAGAGTMTGSGTTGAGANGATSGPSTTGPGSGGNGTSTTGTGQGTGGVSTGSVMTGVGGGPTTTTGEGGSEICPSFGDSCTNCMSQTCPGTYCGCYENPECLALLQCSGACGGASDCQQMCLSAHPAGISDVLLLSDCAGTTCDASCGWGQPANPCEKCILSDCSAEMNACLSVPSCLLLWQCLNACPPLNLVCQQGCYEAHGDGTMLLQAVLDCATSTCPSSCN